MGHTKPSTALFMLVCCYFALSGFSVVLTLIACKQMHFTIITTIIISTAVFSGCHLKKKNKVIAAPIPNL